MANEFMEHIAKIRQKTDQLEHALESDSILAASIALSSAHDICEAAINSLPDIVDIHPDFFKSLRQLKEKPMPVNCKPTSPSNYLAEEKDCQDVSEY